MRPLIAVALLLSSALHAQEKLVESIEVRVTNVDVVVTDKQGRPVPGLAAADFQLFEDGKPQAITHFYEVGRAELPGSGSQLPVTGNQQPATITQEPLPKPRRVVLFIDNYSLHPFRRTEVLAAVDRSFDKLFRPGDQAMVVAWNRGLKVIVPFTGDPKAIREALRKYANKAGAGEPLDFDRQRVRSSIESVLQMEERGGNMSEAAAHASALARDYAQGVYMNEKALLKAMSVMITTLAGFEGKKAMIVTSAEMPGKPGLDIFQLVDQMFGSATRNAAGTWDLAPEYESLARQANANGVTLYMIDGSEGARQSERSSVQFTNFQNTAHTFGLLAQMTGGMALVRTNNFDLALDTLANDLSAYYSLGYKPAGEQRGDRKIEVKVSNPEYRVRSRTSYVVKSSADRAEDRIIANAFHGQVTGDIELKVNAGMPSKHTNDRWKVPVRITFPSDITLIPNGDVLQGSFTVLFVVADDDGTISSVTRRQQPVQLPKSAERALRSKPISFTAEVVVTPGDHYISVGVVDDIADTEGFARARIRAR